MVLGWYCVVVNEVCFIFDECMFVIVSEDGDVIFWDVC